MVRKDEKYTVITGASSGIGYDAAKAFAALGKNLILVARRRSNLETLKKEILKDSPSLDIIIKVTDLSVLENAYRLYSDLQAYQLETWINNAGVGLYGDVASQDMQKIAALLRLNVESLTILSSLFVRDYKNLTGTQLINVSSSGGYIIVPTATVYCAAKFYVSVFTEGLARELKAGRAKMQVKLLAPAATKTEFGKVANNVEEYDYDKLFGTYHTSRQIADFLIKLYNSDKVVGIVDRETFDFRLCDPIFAYAESSKHNQKVISEDK